MEQALKRHTSFHVGSEHLFVVGAEDMMMGKNTYNLHIPGAPRPGGGDGGVDINQTMIQLHQLWQVLQSTQGMRGCSRMC